MDLAIRLDDFQVNERRALYRVLCCSDDEELNGKLNQIGKAAINEYLEMMLGKQLPTRANEIWERRLFHLMKNYFVGTLPSETEISALFQLTEAESKSLLRKTRTKFRFNLEDEILNTVRTALLMARAHNNGDYRLVINSENILEELKQMVSQVAIELEQIKKLRDSAGVYVISEDVYDRLCEAYDITEDMRREVAAAMEGNND